MKLKISARVGLLFCLLLGVQAVGASAPAKSDAWDQWLDNKLASQELPVVTHRLHEKSGRLAIVGTMGLMERKDFNNHYLFSAAGRYYFSERHGWEVVRVTYDQSSIGEAASAVTSQTSYRLDSRQAPLSLSTGYLYAPVYGKYALSEKSMVHFDAYIGGSLGLRFASGQTQPTLEPVMGVQHHFNEHLTLILPEIRARFYSEKRTTSTTVTELMVQAGVSWIF